MDYNKEIECIDAVIKQLNILKTELKNTKKKSQKHLNVTAR